MVQMSCHQYGNINFVHWTFHHSSLNNWSHTFSTENNTRKTNETIEICLLVLFICIVPPKFLYLYNKDRPVASKCATRRS